MSQSSTLPRRFSRGPRAGRRRRGLLLRHEAGALLRIAGPIIFAQVGGIGMNTMDTIMVGPLGPEALAAAGLASSLHMAMLMVSSGVVMGMGPLVSQAFGAGERQQCRRVLIQGLWLAVALSVPLAALNLVGEPLALLLGQAPRVAELAGGYMAALTWGVLPLLLFTAFRQFLEGMGRTKPAMVITFFGLVVNYVGNRCLIYGVPGWVEPMGVVGSGWATTIVRWAMLGAMAVYLARQADIHPFRGVRLPPEGALLRGIVRVGLPTGAQIGLEIGLFSLAAVMMGWFGAVELGTHQVTLNIAATTFMVALGMSMAGAIRVGQNVGAGNVAGVRRATVLAYAFAVGFMALCALLFLAVPERLIRLYTDAPEVVRLGRSLLLIAALFQISDGAQVVGISVLRGAADTRVPMWYAAIAYWAVGAPGAYLLGFHSPLGPVGVWVGLSLGLAVAAVLLLFRVRAVLWKSTPALVVRVRSA